MTSIGTVVLFIATHVHSGTAIVMQEFDNMDACIMAKKEILWMAKEHKWFSSLESVHCMPKNRGDE